MRTVSMYDVYIHDLHANAHLMICVQMYIHVHARVACTTHTHLRGVAMQNTATCCSRTISRTHTTRRPSGEVQLAGNWGTC